MRLAQLQMPAPAPAAAPSAEDGKLRKATEDFEGLLIGQMLQSIRESSLGGWQEHHDQAGAAALEMAETQLAQVMASQGGLGIARALQASMARQREAAPPQPPAKLPPGAPGGSAV